MPHEWKVEEDAAVMALAKKYGEVGRKSDPLATILIRLGIPEGYLGMAIQNFLHLMGLPGGLDHASKGSVSRSGGLFSFSERSVAHALSPRS